VKLALGGGYLAQGFDYTQSSAPAPEKASRGVAYLFGEADVPLVRRDDERMGLNTLDLTLAGRIERYSDFGITANPKVGLRYQPESGLVLRGTWGTSFKAPQFAQEKLANSAGLFQAAALGGSTGLALLAYGGNPQLKPERSKSWTAGVNWSPPQFRSLTVSLTYFNIDYTNRIILPFNSPAGVLANPAYASFVVANPTLAQQAAAIASAPSLINDSGQAYDPAQVVALLEDHYINASAQKIDGVDLSIKKGFVLPLGSLETFAGASWLHIQQQIGANAPVQTLTGTLFNPATAKVRSGLTWTYGAFTSTGILNWIAGESDNGVTPAVPVSAWTTVDVVATYRLDRVAPRLPGLEGALAITNLFDRAPPYARGAGAQYAGYDFDSTNASAIGRFISLTLRQRF
jgi:iron complex outermembrane receptor protein